MAPPEPSSPSPSDDVAAEHAPDRHAAEPAHDPVVPAHDPVGPAHDPVEHVHDPVVPEPFLPPASDARPFPEPILPVAAEPVYVEEPRHAGESPYAEEPRDTGESPYADEPFAAQVPEPSAHVLVEPETHELEQLEPEGVSTPRDRPLVSRTAPGTPVADIRPEFDPPIPPLVRRRSPLTRLLALLALAGVVVVVVVLLIPQLKSKPSKPAVKEPVVVKVLIPEGKTRAQIAEITTKDKLTGSYRRASRRSSLLSPSHYGAPSDTPDLEGFLFPATYDMNPGDPVSKLVQEQLVAFKEHFGSSEIARAKALGVTPYGLLTVASMIEREAQIPSDRAKIAAVIYNRLNAGIPLGIDATIYYAVEQEKGIATYTKELTETQLHTDSPYNTRLHTGLPPTPISNPGAASIEAATHPAHVSYLYYVAGADGCGEQRFSTSLEAFEKNAAAYDEAVKKNGGKPPVCKSK